jgi:hypothetical protein
MAWSGLQGESAEDAQEKLRSLRTGENERKTKIANIRSKLAAAETILHESQGSDQEQAKKAEAKRVGGQRVTAEDHTLKLVRAVQTDIRRQIFQLDGLDQDDAAKKAQIQDANRRSLQQITHFQNR